MQCRCVSKVLLEILLFVVKLEVDFAQRYEKSRNSREKNVRRKLTKVKNSKRSKKL